MYLAICMTRVHSGSQQIAPACVESNSSGLCIGSSIYIYIKYYIYIYVCVLCRGAIAPLGSRSWFRLTNYVYYHSNLSYCARRG